MKRYHLVKQMRTSCDCAANIPGTGMQEHEDGEWVRYADVKHLIEPTAEANANTVMGVVATPEEMKCCGNCEHQLNDFNLRISCEIDENIRIIPCSYCIKWKYDGLAQEKRNINKPKP